MENIHNAPTKNYEVKERLKALMYSKSMNGVQLVQVAGVPKSTVYDILAGKANGLNIGVDKMLKIAAALDVTVEQLYGRSIPISLYRSPDPDEQRLLDQFNAMDDEGKEKAISYLEDLVDTGKYKKHNTAGVVQKKAL